MPFLFIIGAKGDLNPHLNSCVFESLKPFILKTTQRIAELQATVEVPTECERIGIVLKLKKTNKTQKAQEKEISRFKRMVSLRSSQERRIVVSDEKEKEKEPSGLTELPPIEGIEELVTTDSWNIDDIRCIYTLTGHDRGMSIYLSCLVPKRKFTHKYKKALRP